MTYTIPGLPLRNTGRSSSGHIKMLKSGGARIKAKMFKKDTYYGARTGLFVAPQGGGKTTALINLLINFFKHGYLAIWREIELAQFNRIEATGVPVQVFAHEYDEIIINALPKDGGKPFEYDVELMRYSDGFDLYQKLREDAINVVIEPSYYIPSPEFIEDVFNTKSITKSKLKSYRNFPSSAFWIEFNYVLAHRDDRRWINLNLDEIDDIYPAQPTGLLWTLVQWGKDQIKHLRKAFIATYGATQAYANVNWDVASKFQDIFLMKGATKPKRAKQIKDSWLQNDKLLKKGWAIVQTADGEVGLIQFKPLPPVEFDLHIKKTWDGPTPTLEELFEEYGLI